MTRPWAWGNEKLIRTPLVRERKPVVFRITRIMVKLLLFPFFRIETGGIEHLPKQSAFILLPKHQRWEDIPLLVRCLESSFTDFGNIFHFRKNRPTALNSNIQIPNSKQSANPNFQNSKQKHSEGSVLVCYLDFWSLVFVCHLRFAIWYFRVSGNGSKTEHSSRISNCHF